MGGIIEQYKLIDIKSILTKKFKLFSYRLLWVKGEIYVDKKVK